MIDIDELSLMTGGDADILEQIIQMYMEEHANDDDKLRTQLSNGDCESMFHTVHTLKGALCSMCEKDAVEILEIIEAQTKRGELPEEEVLEQANSKLLAVRNQLQAQLA